MQERCCYFIKKMSTKCTTPRHQTATQCTSSQKANTPASNKVNDHKGEGKTAPSENDHRMTKRKKNISKVPNTPSQKHRRASSSSTILTIKETLRTALLKTQSLRCFQISHPMKMCSNSPVITKIKSALVVHRLHHIFHLSFHEMCSLLAIVLFKCP